VQVVSDDLVPRETAARNLALQLFGDRAAAGDAYADLLRGDATVRGLLGPREGARLWERHILNCACVGELLEPGTSVVDIGSGAGLPGIPLALTAAAPQVTLVEPLLRRATFLQDAVQALHLTDSVDVLRARAESMPVTAPWEVATARAVAALDVLARLSRPLLRPDGRLLALKGASASEELEGLRGRLRKIGFRDGRVVQCGPPGFTTTVVELW
jgi:16S rRNA (guanine527-N7)-methyltransferase